MAILTSKNGLYEIETLSFSPNAIVWGEKSTCTVSITNKTGKKLSGVFVHLMIYYNAAGDASTKDHFGYTLIDIDGYWAVNTTKTLTISVPRYEANVMSGRAIPSFTSRAMPKAKRKIGNTTYTRGCELHVYTSSEAYNDEFEDLYGSNHKYFAIIDKHYLPTISDTFAVNRKNDESTECWTTLQVGYADGLTDVQKARMTCKAYYDGTEITLPDSITQGVLVAGITENYDFLSNQPVDIADDHIIKVVFGDQYEQAEDSRTVMRCFANLHLSGYRTGGVCVGGFCDDEKDSDGNHIAKFECYYPAYFYNGITVGGGSGGSIELEADTLLFGFMSNGKKDIYLTVPVPYMPSSVTTVTVTSIKGNVRCAGGYGAASAYVEGGTDYTSLVAAVTPCPSIGAVTIRLTRSTAMNGTNNYALTFQVSELKMTIS